MQLEAEETTSKETDQKALGKAYNKLRICHGISPSKLSSLSHLSVDTISKFVNGHETSSKTTGTLIKTLNDATGLNISPPGNLITEAEKLPDISHDLVDKCIVHAKLDQNVSLAELEAKTKKLMPEDNSSGEFVHDHYRAKALGYDSLGDMVKQLAPLVAKKSNTTRSYSDAELVSTVETLRKEADMSEQELADKLKISLSTYAHSVHNHYFSDAIKHRLPSAFGLKNMDDIFAEVAKLDPVPNDRIEYGASVKKLLHTPPPHIEKITHITLAERIGCGITTLTKIEEGDPTVSDAILRRIPSAIGCKPPTMQQLITDADISTEHLEALHKAHNKSKGNNIAGWQELAEQGTASQHPDIKLNNFKRGQQH